jgi:hypothetical protein
MIALGETVEARESRAGQRPGLTSTVRHRHRAGLVMVFSQIIVGYEHPPMTCG